MFPTRSAQDQAAYMAGMQRAAAAGGARVDTGLAGTAAPTPAAALAAAQASAMAHQRALLYGPVGAGMAGAGALGMAGAGGLGPTAAAVAVARERELHRAAMQSSLAQSVAARESIRFRAEQQRRAHAQQQQQQQRQQQQQQQQHAQLPKGKKSKSGKDEVIEIASDSSEDENSSGSKRGKTSRLSAGAGGSAGAGFITGHESTIETVRKRQRFLDLAAAGGGFVGVSPAAAATGAGALAQQQQQQRTTTGGVTPKAGGSESGRPLVIVQNWTKEGLISELSREEDERTRNILKSIFYHATGHTAKTAPPNVPFPPTSVELDIEKIHHIAKDIISDQKTVLKRSIDVTFHKCAQLVRSGGKEDPVKMKYPDQPSPSRTDELGPATVTATSPLAGATVAGGATANGSEETELDPLHPRGGRDYPIVEKKNHDQRKIIGQQKLQIQEQVKVIQKQKLEIQQNRQYMTQQEAESKNMKKSMQNVEQKLLRERQAFEAEKQHWKEELKKSKTFHARSARACMIASVKSLRYMREASSGMMDADDNNDCENENRRNADVINNNNEELNDDDACTEDENEHDKQ